MQKYKIVKKLREFAVGRGRAIEYEVKLPTGVVSTFFRREGRDVAIIIACAKNQKFVMVRQYRFGSDEISLEFPMGLVDAGEEPEQAAQRELQEETGYSARTCKYLSSFSISPAWNTQKGHVFVASDPKEGHAHTEPEEIIEVELLTGPQIDKAIAAGQINDVSTIASWHLFKIKDRAEKVR
jgi:ADP-ribose pyrophosphatase